MTTIAQEIARLKLLKDERAELEQNYLSAQADMNGYGTYGQVSQRDSDAAEYAEMSLKNWDEDFAVELRHLTAKHGRRISTRILEQRL